MKVNIVNIRLRIYRNGKSLVNPYGRDKIEEYKLNKVKENFDGADL